MGTLSTLVVKLLGDISGFTKPMQEAEGVASSTSKSLGSNLTAGAMTAAVAIGNLAAQAIPKLLDGLKDLTMASISYGDTLDRMGDITGATADESAALYVATRRVGGDFDKIADQLAFFGKGLTDVKGKIGPVGLQLKQMGIDVYETGKSVTVTGKALSDVKLTKLQGDLQTATARLHDMQAAMGRTKNPTESATLALAKQQEKVAALSAALQKGGAVITSTLTEKGPLKSSVQLLKDVADKLDEMPDGLEKSDTMMQLFGKSGKEMSDVIHSIAKGGLDEAAKQAKLYGLAIGEEGVAASVKAKNTMAQLDLIGQGLAVTFSTELLPAILPILESLILFAQDAIPKVREGIKSVINWLKPLGSILTTAGGKAIEIFKGIGDAFDMLMTDLSAGDSVGDAISKFVANIAQSFGIGEDSAYALGDAIGSFAQDAYNFVFNLVQVFNDLFTRIGDGKTSVMDLVSDFVSGIAQIFGASEEVGAQIGGIFGTIATIAQQEIQFLITLFQSVVQWVVANWPMIQATIVNVFNAVVAFVLPIVQAIVTYLGQVVQWVIANWPMIQQTIVSVFNYIVGVVGPILQAVLSTVIGVVSAIISWIQQNGPQIAAFFEESFNTISQILTGLGALIGPIIQQIIEQFKAVATFVQTNQQGIQDFISLVWGTIKLVIETVLTTVRGVINTLLALVKGDWQGAWNSIQQTLYGIWENIVNWFSGIPSKLVEIGRLAIEGLIKGLQDNAQQVVAALGKIVQDAIDSIKTFLGIHSPSTLMGDIAENTVSGFINKLRRSGPLVADQLNKTFGVPAVNLAYAGGVSPTTEGIMAQAATDNRPIQIDVNLDGKTFKHLIVNTLTRTVTEDMGRFSNG